MSYRNVDIGLSVSLRSQEINELGFLNLIEGWVEKSEIVTPSITLRPTVLPPSFSETLPRLRPIPCTKSRAEILFFPWG